jgi:diacylglycerol kinase (ATP)
MTIPTTPTPNSPSDPTPGMATKPPPRAGLARILHAAGYSWSGLKAGWGESAFRQEALLAIVMLPAALWLGRTWLERALLIAVVMLVLIVELLNTAVECVVDRIGPEWHELSKLAKDFGSAAVLLALLLCGGIWAVAAWARWFA